ncbi:MAG: methyltransferase domain-containing protein [Chitinispirillaceae bacterium]|nr:methyltransferase domain-containing protein [Chitinispirillaceae bacterium]
MKAVTKKDFFSLLRRVRVIDNGAPVELNEEERVYLDFHADRYYATYRFLTPLLGQGALRILDIGLSPYFTTVLQHLTAATYTGVRGGRRLDHLIPEKKHASIDTRLGSEQYSLPVFDGYDLESDRLPFDDETFDVVLFLEVIEHFIADPVFPLKEVGRVLKPGGVLILTTDNSHCFIKLINFLALRRPLYWPYNSATYGDRHNREYMPGEIRKLLEGIGFADVAVSLKNLAPSTASPGKRAGFALINALTNLPYLRRFKRQIFASARKSEIRDFYPGWLFMRREG